MSDRFSANISIGGRVSIKLVKKLCKAIAASGAGTDYTEDYGPTDKDDLLMVAAECGGTLDLMDDQARYGQFEELEKFLVKHGIAFDRHSEAYCEYDSELVIFRPGMKEPRVVRASTDGKVVVLAEDVMKVVEQLKAADQKGIAEAIGSLSALCADDIPPLEPFKI